MPSLSETPERCSYCQVPYKNIGHPLKPGVIMQQLCECTLEFEEVSVGNTVARLVPPKAQAESQK